jgi:hypothetical protein
VVGRLGIRITVECLAGTAKPGGTLNRVSKQGEHGGHDWKVSRVPFEQRDSACIPQHCWDGTVFDHHDSERRSRTEGVVAEASNK